MPNRILKESICTSDTIDQLNWFEEVLFYRLIVSCDDYGRFDGRTSIIKNRLFPLKNDLTLKTVESAIQKLASSGLVITYESMGKPYLYLPTWTVHQNVRAKKSKYPEPAIGNHAHEIKCEQMDSDVPVIQSNPIRESVSVSEDDTRIHGDASAAVAAVLADYLNRINPSASPSSLDELKGYAEEMGEAVCKRAFDIALDNKVTKWPYIRGILRSKLADGVRCLADWDALESKREQNRGSSAQRHTPQSGNVFMDMLREEEHGTQ